MPHSAHIQPTISQLPQSMQQQNQASQAGSSADCFDAVDPDEVAPDTGEDKHHAIDKW